MCSMMDDANSADGPDLYSQSVLVSSMVKEPEDLIDKDLIQLLAFIKRLPMPTEEQIETKKLEFGEITRYKTLIFDLDETLIHSKLINPATNTNQAMPQPQGVSPGALNSDIGTDAAVSFEISLPGSQAKFLVTQRPYMRRCLEHLSTYYEMAIFTAAEQTYADLIIDIIDPERKFFSQRLYRHHCFKVDEVYVKDLRIIDDRCLEDMIIVDNSILSFAG